MDWKRCKYYEALERALKGKSFVFPTMPTGNLRSAGIPDGHKFIDVEKLRQVAAPQVQIDQKSTALWLTGPPDLIVAAVEASLLTPVAA